jgi:uncharacterized protein (DUF3084 family)
MRRAIRARGDNAAVLVAVVAGALVVASVAIVLAMVVELVVIILV